MNRESFRLWSLLRKGSVVCVVFLLASLFLEIRNYLAASATREVELIWSKSQEHDVAGYNVYYGPVSRYEAGFDEYLYRENLGPGDYLVQDPKVHYVLSSLDENLSYWVAVTAYDQHGNESLYSNEKQISPFDDTVRFDSDADSGGCQMVPAAAPSKVSGRAGRNGWVVLFILVPAWILRLRRRLTA